MRTAIVLTCATASNAIYVPVPFECTLLAATYVASANQGATKTVVISKPGGNTIISGDLSGTAGTPTTGTKTATLADAKQVLSPTAPLLITVNLTGGTAAEVAFILDFDEFKRTTD